MSSMNISTTSAEQDSFDDIGFGSEQFEESLNIDDSWTTIKIGGNDVFGQPPKWKQLQSLKASIELIEGHELIVNALGDETRL